MFAHRSVIALRKINYEVVRARQPCSLYDAIHWHAWIANRDVISHTSVKEKVLLENDTQLAPKPSGVRQRQVMSINQDAPTFWHV